MSRRHALLAVVSALAALTFLAAALASKASPESPRFAALVAESRAATRSVSVPALRARIQAGDKDFTLIDVREDSEWEGDRLPGAIHVGRGVLEMRIEKAVPDPDAEIVLYCAGGARSTLAAESLGRMGYRRVYSLEGGAREWFASSPVVRKGSPEK